MGGQETNSPQSSLMPGIRQVELTWDQIEQIFREKAAKQHAIKLKNYKIFWKSILRSSVREPGIYLHFISFYNEE